jgi:hypothetical protein
MILHNALLRQGLEQVYRREKSMALKNAHTNTYVKSNSKGHNSLKNGVQHSSCKMWSFFVPSIIKIPKWRVN